MLAAPELDCMHDRAAVCRIKRELAGAAVEESNAALVHIEWCWCHRPAPNCQIGVAGGLRDGCQCALDYATFLLQTSLVADAEARPDDDMIGRIIALALGPSRTAVIEVNTPTRPPWIAERVAH